MSEEKTVRERKVESLREYIEKNGVQGLTEQEWNEGALTSFQGVASVAGQTLPLAINLDDSVYTGLQVLLLPKALKEDNELALLKFINQANGDYSMLKYWLSNTGDLILSVCIPAGADHFDAELVINILNEVINHLNTEYAEIMKVVWSE